MSTGSEIALQIIADKGGTVRRREALSAGIHPRTLYALRDNGRLVQLARGLYRLADLPPVGDPDLALFNPVGNTIRPYRRPWREERVPPLLSINVS